MIVEDVALGAITIPAGRRKAKPAKVKALADSILEIGLQQPIGVRVNGHGYALVYGRHRLEAYRSLARPAIPAVVLDCDDLRAELAEIDENLCRNELTALEQGEALKRRKQVYLALHPETKQHAAGGHAKAGSASGILPFASETAQKTGVSRSTVERSVAIAESLTEAAKTQIADTPVADNKAELKRLASLPAEQQERVAAAIGSGKAKTVAEGKKVARVDDSAGERCPVCASSKWTNGDNGEICRKCKHPRGEPAGDPDVERITIQRRKTFKTAEALMRAFDDLHTMLSRKKHHDEAIAECKRLMVIAENWK